MPSAGCTGSGHETGFRRLKPSLGALKSARRLFEALVAPPYRGYPVAGAPERFPPDSEVVSEEVLSSSAAERVSRGFQGHRVTLERFPLDSEIVSEEVLSSSAAERISRGYQGHRVSPEPSLTGPRVVRGAARLPCAVMPARQRQQAIAAQWLGGLSRGRHLSRRRGFETRWPRRVLPLSQPELLARRRGVQVERGATPLLF